MKKVNSKKPKKSREELERRIAQLVAAIQHGERWGKALQAITLARMALMEGATATALPPDLHSSVVELYQRASNLEQIMRIQKAALGRYSKEKNR